MNKVIIVRVCEIFLKGKNRFYFVNLLEENIKKALDGIKYDLVKLQMRYLVENFDEDKYDLIMSKLLKVCGIHTMSVAYCVESDVDKIAEAAIAECEDMKGSFKVETNRADKTFPLHSVELSAEIGGRILERYGKDLYVDVKKPKNILKIDIRENGQSLIYKDVIKGVGGMPVGSSGKGFLMLSGGIDSPERKGYDSRQDDFRVFCRYDLVRCEIYRNSGRNTQKMLGRVYDNYDASLYDAYYRKACELSRRAGDYNGREFRTGCKSDDGKYYFVELCRDDARFQTAYRFR